MKAKRVDGIGAEGSLQRDIEVEEYFRNLVHPLKRELEEVREILLHADVGISEGIKWNAPSFRTTEWFATLNNPQKKDRIILILHTGAKAKGLKMKGRIPEGVGSMKWLGDDRCMIKFADDAELKAGRAGLEAIVREWIRHL